MSQGNIAGLADTRVLSGFDASRSGLRASETMNRTLAHISSVIIRGLVVKVVSHASSGLSRLKARTSVAAELIGPHREWSNSSNHELLVILLPLHRFAEGGRILCVHCLLSLALFVPPSGLRCIIYIGIRLHRNNAKL